MIRLGFDEIGIFMNRRDPIWLAWAIGLALAVLVYVVGPDRFAFRVLDSLHVLAWRIGEASTLVMLSSLARVDAILVDGPGPRPTSKIWKVANVNWIVWVNGCSRCKPPSCDRCRWVIE